MVFDIILLRFVQINHKNDAKIRCCQQAIASFTPKQNTASALLFSHDDATVLWSSSNGVARLQPFVITYAISFVARIVEEQESREALWCGRFRIFAYRQQLAQKPLLLKAGIAFHNLLPIQPFGGCTLGTHTHTQHTHTNNRRSLFHL